MADLLMADLLMADLLMADLLMADPLMADLLSMLSAWSGLSGCNDGLRAGVSSADKDMPARKRSWQPDRPLHVC
jgi:hypothetical protein